MAYLNKKRQPRKLPSFLEINIKGLSQDAITVMSFIILLFLLSRHF